MTLTASEDECGIDAFLHIGSQRRLDIGRVRVFQNLLELINANQAGFVCLREVIEYFVECGFWIFNIPKAKAPSREVVNIVCNLTT